MGLMCMRFQKTDKSKCGSPQIMWKLIWWKDKLLRKIYEIMCPMNMSFFDNLQKLTPTNWLHNILNWWLLGFVVHKYLLQARANCMILINVDVSYDLFSRVVFLASYVSDSHKIHINWIFFFYYILQYQNIFMCINTPITLPVFLWWDCVVYCLTF